MYAYSHIWCEFLITSFWLKLMRSILKSSLDVSAVYENLNIVEHVTIAVYIHDQTECNQWPGNYLGYSMLNKP